MPVQIDELSAEVQPPPSADPRAATPATGGASTSGETDPRRLRDALDRLERRAQRVRAD